MISDLLDDFIFDPIKEVIAFIIYWVGWFVIIPLAIWCLYKLVSMLYANIVARDWIFIIIQSLLIIGLVFLSCRLFVGLTNTGKSIDPNRPTGIEKSIQEEGKEYD
ncbi:hypothetical protein [Staphylococcus gallinarum]|uniref:hypothetical protein n=1 Tax=Staphylococcus gallinarum TaxID=1293 RepID=UPI00318043D0